MHTSQPSDSSRALISLYWSQIPPVLLGQIVTITLKRVVHHLRRVEEPLATVDHVPLAVQADVDHQRHERIQDLRDAASERGRRQMEDALAPQSLGALADLVHQRPPDDARVVGEMLVGDDDGLEHGLRVEEGDGTISSAAHDHIAFSRSTPSSTALSSFAWSSRLDTEIDDIWNS
jgi:hypothetical protein